MKVLVIGGGVGGLCLAQGLRRAGIEVRVFERNASAEGRMQGYRLRISPDGEKALRACLPPDAQALLAATSNARHQAGLAAYDERLNEQPAPSFQDPRGDRADKVDAVDRVTLRRVLLAGLDDVVEFGRRYVRHDVFGGRVVARFDDGGTETGDVLIAADGANSAVRQLIRPDDTVRDLGVRAILSRTPRAVAVRAGLPEVLRDRFLNVTAADGLRLALMPMVFRTPPRVAADEHRPGTAMADVDDYYMSVFSVHRDLLGVDDERFFAMTGEELRDLVLERTVSWHPDLRGIFAHAEPAETYPLALRAKTPVEAWELPSRIGPVIPLGDAVHLMPPTGGVGANTALRDAAGLVEKLSAVQRGELTLEEASRTYQAAMVSYATEAIDMSLNIARWSMKKIDVSSDRTDTVGVDPT